MNGLKGMGYTRFKAFVQVLQCLCIPVQLCIIRHIVKRKLQSRGRGKERGGVESERLGETCWPQSVKIGASEHPNLLLRGVRGELRGELRAELTFSTSAISSMSFANFWIPKLFASSTWCLALSLTFSISARARKYFSCKCCQ